MQGSSASWLEMMPLVLLVASSLISLVAMKPVSWKALHWILL